MILTGYGLTSEYKGTKKSKLKTIVKVKSQKRDEVAEHRFQVLGAACNFSERRKRQTDNFLYLYQIPGETDIL